MLTLSTAGPCWPVQNPTRAVLTSGSQEISLKLHNAAAAEARGSQFSFKSLDMRITYPVVTAVILENFQKNLARIQNT